jgi:hypothetical protein
LGQCVVKRKHKLVLWEQLDAIVEHEAIQMVATRKLRRDVRIVKVMVAFPGGMDETVPRKALEELATMVRPTVRVKVQGKS